MILDGEVVAFDKEGRPSFQALQSRMHLASESAVRRKVRELPVTYVIFDLLWLDGHSTLSLTYEDRRRLLESLELEGPALAHARLPRRRRGGAAGGQQGAGHRGDRGQAPRLPLRARPPRIGLDQGQERDQPGARDRRVDAGRGRPREQPRRPAASACTTTTDALLLRRARSGTGFTEATLGLLKRELEPLQARRPARSTAASRRRAPCSWSRSWWRAWSSASGPRPGTLRAPSFKGLRDDVDPAEVVREPQDPPAGKVELGRTGIFGGSCQSHLERRDQLRAGQHPGEALQRRLAQDGALQPAGRRGQLARPAEAGATRAPARRFPTRTSSRATRSAPSATW